MRRPGLDNALAAIALRLRRQLDAVPPVEPQSPKPVWNTLEAAKIGVGIVTSVAVAYLGYVVTVRNTERQYEIEKSLRTEAAVSEDKRQKRADLREMERQRSTQRHQETLAAQSNEQARQIEALRQAEAALAAKLARENEARVRAVTSAEAREVREEARRYELALRAESDRREAANRAEARREARLDRIYAQRHQAWQRIGPQAEEIRRASWQLWRYLLGDTPERRAPTVKGIADQADAIEKIRLSIIRDAREASVYFSEEFVAAFGEWTSSTADFARQVRVTGNADVFGQTKPPNEAAFQEFMKQARLELRMEDETVAASN